MKKAFFVSAIIAILITASVAVAASTQTWGGASNNLWATSGNWTSAVPGTTDTAQFNGAGNGNTSISLGGVSRPINTISFTGASAAAYTLGVLSSGDQFSVDAGGAITEASSAINSQTINAAIQANGALTISNSSTAGSLSLAGNIGGASGSISYGGATNGVIKILGQNTYAGNTTINVAANTLQIGSSSNSGTLTSGPFGTGTILTNSGTNSPMQAINADQVVANPMTLIFGFTVSNAATPFNLSFTGPMTYNSASTRTITINTPNKTVTFGSASSPSTITLNAVAATALLIDPSQNSTLVINDVMQDNGAVAGSINYNSIGNNTPMGTVQLNGANTYSGGTSLNGQTSGSVVGLTVQIGVDTVGSPGSITSGPFGKGTVTTNGNSGGPPILQAFGTDRTVANAISMTSGFFVSGLHNLNLTGPVTLGSTSRTITNNLASGLTLTLGSAGSPSSMTLGNTLIFQTQTAGGGMTIINDAIGGTGGLTVQNSAVVVLSNANNYAGATSVNNATVTLTNTAGSGLGAGTITVSNNGTLQIGNGGANGSVNNSNITDNANVTFNRSDDTTYSGTVSGTGVVNKKGTGTLSLPNANSYGGGTTQIDGGLKLGDKASLGTGTYTIGDATTSTTLKVSSTTNLTGANAVNNSVTVARDFSVASGSSDLELSGAMTLGAVNRTITVDSSNATILSGVISDTGGTAGITKAGSGILTLEGANTYGTAGVTSTFVTGGKLLVNNTSGSGTGPGNVSVTAGTLGGTGSIAGSVSVSGTGHLSPGASINVLGIGGNLSMTGGSFDYEINRDTVNADLNNATGNLSLTTVALSASDLGVGALPLAMGTKFTLINYGGTWNSGTFTGLANHSTNLVIGLNRFQIDYDATSGGSNFGGGSVGAGSHYVTITAVPEASTFLVMGLGGIFAFAAVRIGKRMGINVLKA